MFLRKFSLPFTLASSSWLISTQFYFWSSLNKHGMNFELTGCIWRFSIKIWWQDPMLMPTSSATSRTVKWQFPRITAWAILTWSSFVDVEGHPGGIFTDQHYALVKTLKPLIALRSPHTVFHAYLVKQLKCLCKMFTKFEAKFHIHTLFFKLFHCHFFTTPTNSLCTCWVQWM